MKVFIGLTNIASMYSDLKHSFKNEGIQTYIVTRYLPHTIIHEYSDFNIQIAKNRIPYFRPGRISIRLKAWWEKKIDRYIYKKALKECDVFIFFWDTFKNDYSDLKLLKEAKKTVINVFVGDDVRWYESMKQEFESYKFAPIEYGEVYDNTLKALSHKLSYLRTAEKYADFIFSRLDQAQLQLRPYYRWNMMVRPKQFKNTPAQRKFRPIVAHAPSSRAGKGTKYVLEAFEQLQKDGIEFEPMLIENVANETAIEMYGKADILIDQLFCPGAGKLATEALASGKIVMSHMAYGIYPQKNPEDCPIIDVNHKTLYVKLKEVILDFNLREEHAKKSRKYVEKCLDIDLFTRKVLDLVKGENSEYDFKPAFFREQFIPESIEAAEVYNEWNNYVKDCNWYKTNIEPGERAGLKF